MKNRKADRGDPVGLLLYTLPGLRSQIRAPALTLAPLRLLGDGSDLGIACVGAPSQRAPERRLRKPYLLGWRTELIDRRGPKAKRCEAVGSCPLA